MNFLATLCSYIKNSTLPSSLPVRTVASAMYEPWLLLSSLVVSQWEKKGSLWSPGGIAVKDTCLLLRSAVFYCTPVSTLPDYIKH